MDKFYKVTITTTTASESTTRSYLSINQDCHDATQAILDYYDETIFIE